MSETSSNATNHVKAVFGKALEFDSPEERSAYVAVACADAPELREEVEQLLRAIDGAGSLLAGPILDPKATVEAPRLETPCEQIGPYKLLQQIGEGGFGVVFMAQQVEPIKRKVALKVVKPGMDTREVIARFESERQALAMMDHPNIAQVFDAGTTESGRPYFVMELVRGVPITNFCDDNYLNPRERMSLFIHVCQAVQHAHQKGIIHRDIKPSNVLVTLDDTGPVVKVIDFGVAKAIGHDLTEKTLFTRFEQMIGTPLYMSPEQTEMRTRDVDTRSDIYSLGVLLYELLTGVTPFERDRISRAAFDEICHIIREEEPPKPSHRISTLGETLTGVSQHRKTEPKKLSTLFKGDVDWIVMRAMEKDRSRRYDTAKDMAADIQRHLNHEPIEARPPSIPYRLQKFARRNKGLVAATSAMAATLVIATITSLAFAAWAISNAREADRQREAAETNLVMANEAKQEAYDAVTDLAGQFLSEERYEEAAAIYRDMVRIRRDRLGGSHPSTLDAVDGLVAAQRSLGLYDETIDLLERTLADLEQAAQKDRTRIDNTKDKLAYFGWNRSRELTANPALSSEELRRAMELAVRAHERFPNAPQENLALAWAEYRAGTASVDSDCMAVIRTRFRWSHELTNVCALHAMVVQQSGDEELARLWFGAMRYYLAKATSNWAIINPDYDYEDELARLFPAVRECVDLTGPGDLALETPPAAKELLPVFTELTNQYPEVGHFHHNRGSLYGRTASWDRAAVDYAEATKIEPTDFRHWEAWLAVMLFLDDREACAEIIADAELQTLLINAQNRTADFLRLLWLCPETETDWTEIYEQLQTFRLYEPERVHYMLQAAKAAYNCGEFEQVLELLELAVAVKERTERRYVLEEVEIPAMRSMALCQLGDVDEAKRSLDEAQTAFREEMSPLDGGYLIFQDRPVIWCCLQVLLRKAAEVVDSKGTLDETSSEGSGE